jgi:hypothetical protein
MPVNCDYRFDHIKDLENELLSPQHAGKLIFIAWEHQYLNQIAKDLLQLKGGDSNRVPDGRGTNMTEFISCEFRSEAARSPLLRFKRT